MTESQAIHPLTARPVFVVRLWWEPYEAQADSAGEWRGSVELLGASTKVYFRDVSQVSEIIAAALGEACSRRRDERPSSEVEASADTHHKI